MMEKPLSQQELTKIVHDLAGQAHGPDRYVVSAIGHLIQSNARLEKTIESFSESTRSTEKIMIILAGSQVVLAAVTIAIAFR